MRSRTVRRRPLIHLGVMSLVVALLALAPTTRTQAQDVTAYADPVRLEVGDVLLYQIKVAGSGTLPTPTVNLPSALQIVSGPNSNVSMQFINGRMSTERTLTYRLRALRSGDHVIPSPEIRVRGKVIKGNPVTILVGSTPSTVGQDTTGSASSSTSTAPALTQANPDINPKDLQPENDEEIFLHVEVEPGEIYFQQPVTVTWTLYFRPNVRTFDVRRLSSTEGFWSEEWPVPNPPDVVRRYVGGVAYNAAVIHRLILFPTKPGELTIGPMDIVVQYQSVRANSLLDDFFDNSFFSGGSLREKEISSPETKVTVKPLPEKGKPAKFDNLVGDWNVQATLDHDTVAVNESAVLEVTISGTGNVGFIPMPDVVIPQDIERYEPETELNKTPDAGTMSGEKKFRYLLIPRRAGRQEIPPIKINYYDPDAKRYFTTKTKPLSLMVMPGNGWTNAQGDVTPGGAATRVETVGRDIRWILDSRTELRRIGPPISEKLSYWLTYLIPAFVALAGLGFMRYREHEAGREVEKRSRRAAKSAINALKLARKYHAAGETKTGYDALAKGILGYLSDRLSVSLGELDEERRRKELSGRKIAEETIKELEDIISHCNTARFTPEGADSDALKSQIERSRKWIERSDRSLAKKR